jgi:hypothetical protein
VTLLATLTNSSFRQKIIKKTSELNDTINQIYLTDKYRIFHLAVTDTHASQQPTELSPKQISSDIKQVLINTKIILIISWILSEHNGIKLEISHRRKYRKYPNTQTLNNSLLNDQWGIKEIKGRRDQKFLKSNENEIRTY